MAPMAQLSARAPPKGPATMKSCAESAKERFVTEDKMWTRVKRESQDMALEEPVLKAYFHDTVLQYGTLECVLIHHLSNKLGNYSISDGEWYTLFDGVMAQHREELGSFIRADLTAVLTRDPACETATQALLNFKGFLALQASRIAHIMWKERRRTLSLAIQSRVSECFGVDIHPACLIGRGVMLDHATGIVFGETAAIGDDCTILHGVTLGGTGKDRGDRHPKLGRGILVGAGALILGNITIGDGCKIAAGSVVLKSLPPHTTAAGVPAKVVGIASEASAPGLEVDQSLSKVDWNPGEGPYLSLCDGVWCGKNAKTATEGSGKAEESGSGSSGLRPERSGEVDAVPLAVRSRSRL